MEKNDLEKTLKEMVFCLDGFANVGKSIFSSPQEALVSAFEGYGTIVETMDILDTYVGNLHQLNKMGKPTENLEDYSSIDNVAFCLREFAQIQRQTMQKLLDSANRQGSEINYKALLKETRSALKQDLKDFRESAVEYLKENDPEFLFKYVNRNSSLGNDTIH